LKTPGKKVSDKRKVLSVEVKYKPSNLTAAQFIQDLSDPLTIFGVAGTVPTHPKRPRKYCRRKDVLT
jgi:hypothetical protein